MLHLEILVCKFCFYKKIFLGKLFRVWLIDMSFKTSVETKNSKNAQNRIFITNK